MKQNINIDLGNVDNVKCEECDGETFVPVFIIKHVSALNCSSVLIVVTLMRDSFRD